MEKRTEAEAVNLARHFVHQKVLIMERHKVRRNLDQDRLMSSLTPRMVKMAKIIEDWDIDGSLIMESVFAYARKNGHADGPLVNMLYSVPYLTKALGYRLGVPYESILDRRDKNFMFDDMDASYKDFLIQNVDSGLDLVFASSFPVEHRYLLGLNRLDFRVVVQLSPQLLENMEKSRLLTLWMEMRNITYQRAAKIFNDRKHAF